MAVITKQKLTLSQSLAKKAAERKARVARLGKAGAEHFRCERLSAVLTRAECALRHVRWRTGRNTSPVKGIGTVSCVCSDCPIGQAHAKGVAEVPVAEIRVPAEHLRNALSSHRYCTTCGKVLEGPQRGVMKYCSPACAKQEWGSNDEVAGEAPDRLDPAQLHRL